MKNSLTFLALKFLSKIFKYLPRKLSIQIGNIFGKLIYLIFPKRKLVAATNMKIAFPNLNQLELENLLKKTYCNFSIMATEFMRQNINSYKNVHIDYETKKILESKSGIILMTAHFGNWELIPSTLSRFKKIAIVVKIQKNFGGDKFIQNQRKINGVELISMKDSKRKMLNAIIDGKILGLASDQNAKHKGTNSLFFNEQVSVPKGAGYFHFKTKIPIVVGFCIMNDDFSYNFKLKPLLVDKKIKDFDGICNMVNNEYSRILEEEIKLHPEQYFWFHKKWNKEIYK